MKGTIKSLTELYNMVTKDDILESVHMLLGHHSYNINCDDWYDGMGMDDLDQVEFIMNLEKVCDIHIDDSVAESIFNNGPKHLISNIVSIKREKVLKEILK